MKILKVRTQAELDAALAVPDCLIDLLEGSFAVSLTTSPRFRVHASVALRLEAWGSSQPHVEAWGSSQPHVEAWGYVQLSLFGKVLAKLSATCSAVIHGTTAKVSGGHQLRVKVSTAKEWCAYYGLDVKRGVAVLYKALNDDYSSSRGFFYKPGTVPSAPDWDGGQKECGGGLHFSPSPAMALEFNNSATRFMACPVKLSEIVVHPNGNYPQKVKAKGCCGLMYEVDRKGVRLEAEKATQRAR